MVHSPKRWARLLVTSSYPLRLGITAACSVIILILHFTTFAITHGNLLTIPVALTAWLFGKRGLGILLLGGTITLILFHTARLGTWLWPPSLLFYILSGLLLLSIEGLIIIMLRNLLSTMDYVRTKAQEAEEHIAIACEQQQQLKLIKDQFLMNMHHELRTPLTELHGYLELLQDHDQQIDSSTRTRFIAHALHASTDLQQAVNTILEAVQVSKQDKSLAAEKLSVVNLVDDIMQNLEGGQQRYYTIQQHIPTHLAITANEQAVRRVLHNLLSNAFKYAPPQTTISINATLLNNIQAKKCQYVCISVQDEGPGIPPYEIPFLFEQFVRLKRDISGQIRGTGLGLYICKQLVEAMGGSIWVDSDGITGHGSRFCFTLPYATL